MAKKKTHEEVSVNAAVPVVTEEPKKSMTAQQWLRTPEGRTWSAGIQCGAALEARLTKAYEAGQRSKI